MHANDKPRARFDGLMWHLRPPPSRPGWHLHYISVSLNAAYEHWCKEAHEIELRMSRYMQKRSYGRSKFAKCR
jgi:hypothetical protein